MLANYHTHSKYCDGKNTLREMIDAAIEKGFDVLGFSGHGYTEFDFTYCMTETDKYLAELSSLRNEYRGKIDILIGVEEDMRYFVDRSRYDYIIGSSHYFVIEGRNLAPSVNLIGGKYQHIDSNYQCMKECVELFDGDTISLAKSYYESFCDYILTRKPDIVGHFDLITKFDEMEEPIFLGDPEYTRLAEKYMEKVADVDCIFEVNTGAISRGYRTLPYPAQNLLHILKKHGAKITLTSDCHAAENLDCFYTEAKKLLSDVGFEYLTMLTSDGVKKEYLK